jgi:asparagine synthetase B (glutamine-hydrolysing)
MLYRDRLGKRLICIYRDRHRLYFASEIKAILQVINATVRINERAVFDYLLQEKQALLLSPPTHTARPEPQTRLRSIFLNMAGS